MPLRERRYRRLSGVLNTAQQKGRTLRDVIDDLTRDAATELEAALLLRDTWEVLRILEARMAQSETPGAREILVMVNQVEKQPFAGEEVMF